MSKNVYREFHVARYVDLHVKKLKAMDLEEWTVKYPRSYLKELKREQDNLNKAIKDLVFLIEQSGYKVYKSQKDDAGYFDDQFKIHKFKKFTAEDFEYIKLLQFKMQTSNPKIDNIEIAREQLETLKDALVDVEMAFYLYLDYFLEK